METKRDGIAERLRALRKGAGLTIEKLATSANVSSQTIKDIEAGRRGAGLEAVLSLSHAFGLTVEEFLNISAPAPAKVLTIKDIARQMANIPECIYELTDEFEITQGEWDEIANMIRKLAPKKHAGRVKSQA